MRLVNSLRKNTAQQARVITVLSRLIQEGNIKDFDEADDKLSSSQQGL